jgi:hypothetical protein
LLKATSQIRYFYPSCIEQKQVISYTFSILKDTTAKLQQFFEYKAISAKEDKNKNKDKY